MEYIYFLSIPIDHKEFLNVTGAAVIAILVFFVIVLFFGWIFEKILGREIVESSNILFCITVVTSFMMSILTYVSVL